MTANVPAVLKKALLKPLIKKALLVPEQKKKLPTSVQSRDCLKAD